jgi:S1-C subfamily serine protease
MIVRVEPLSAAFDAEIERGSVLVEINRRPVESIAEFRRLASAAKPGEVLTLYLYVPDLEQHQIKTVRVD